MPRRDEKSADAGAPAGGGARAGGGAPAGARASAAGGAPAGVGVSAGGGAAGAGGRDREADALLLLNRELLEAIASGDWERYRSLCDPSVTCFEPEARGELVEGLDFHRFYFMERRGGDPVQTTLIGPRVRMLGPDVAVVTCVRLVQSRGAGGTGGAGGVATARFEETRVWRRREGSWLLVHLHRSANP